MLVPVPVPVPVPVVVVVGWHKQIGLRSFGTMSDDVFLGASFLSRLLAR
jgi:hypothetical protein